MTDSRLALAAATFALGLCAAATPASAQPAAPLDHSTPLGIAQAWLEAFLGGDADQAGALSALPFALDGKRVVEARDELDAVYRSRRASPVPPGAYATVAEWPPFEPRDLPPQCRPVQPACSLVRFALDGSREAVYIFVDTRSAARVVGFRD